MIYKNVAIEDFGLELEIQVIPRSATSEFLLEFKVKDGLVTKKNYEEFLFFSLVKDSKKLKKDIDKIKDKHERRLLHLDIIEEIYKINPKLKPNMIIINDTGQLMHRMDSIRAGGPSEPVLTANPNWIDGSNALNELQPELLKAFLDDVWEDIKKENVGDYIKETISSLGTEVPILKISSLNLVVEQFVTDYVYRRCDGNIFLASNDQRLWIGYILGFVIPKLEKFIQVLNEANYMNTYTDNVIYTQVYMAAIRVNPELAWELIDWEIFSGDSEKEETPNTPIKKDATQSPLRKVTSKTPISRKRTKSSRDEIEEEKPKFIDVSYEKVLGLADAIKTRIIGQDKAVESLCDSISVARVGLRGDKRPIGTFLFTGRTGVGKTELSKVLADELANSSLIRIDCSEYQQAHEISKIFGAPPGYVGFEDDSRGPHQSSPPSTVAAKLKATPFSVVLFDEIEKADPAINNVLLQIMDEGHVTSGRGETISFNNAVVVLTSNIGTDEAQEACDANKLGFGEDQRDFSALTESVISEAIKKRFKPEFRNRLTEIIVFNSLTKDVCKGIVDVLLNKTKVNLEKAQHISFLWDDTVREFILEQGFSEEYGAREIMRVIQKQVELPLAKYILHKKYVDNEDQLPSGTTIYISIENDEIKFNEVLPDGEKARIKPEPLLDSEFAKSRSRASSVD